jgi:hypothetical protein
MELRQPEAGMGGKAVLLGSIGIYCTVCCIVHSSVCVNMKLPFWLEASQTLGLINFCFSAAPR